MEEGLGVQPRRWSLRAEGVALLRPEPVVAVAVAVALG